MSTSVSESNKTETLGSLTTIESSPAASAAEELGVARPILPVFLIHPHLMASTNPSAPSAASATSNTNPLKKSSSDDSKSTFSGQALPGQSVGASALASVEAQADAEVVAAEAAAVRAAANATAAAEEYARFLAASQNPVEGAAQPNLAAFEQAMKDAEAEAARARAAAAAARARFAARVAARAAAPVLCSGNCGNPPHNGTCWPKCKECNNHHHEALSKVRFCGECKRHHPKEQECLAKGIPTCGMCGLKGATYLCCGKSNTPSKLSALEGRMAVKIEQAKTALAVAQARQEHLEAARKNSEAILAKQAELGTLHSQIADTKAQCAATKREVAQKRADANAAYVTNSGKCKECEGFCKKDPKTCESNKAKRAKENEEKQYTKKKPTGRL